MREILISSTVFVFCLLLVVFSQLVSPAQVVADPGVAFKTASQSQENFKDSFRNFDLDPDDPNPTLFIMAKDPILAEASVLGSPLDSKDSYQTPSGLNIIELKSGDGPKAETGKTVVVHYLGTLENGQEFDNSYSRGPFSFPLGAGRVIKGWDEGVAGMMVGGKRKLIIPPELGYGSRGAGRVIPPNATLIFEVELLEIKE